MTMQEITDKEYAAFIGKNADKYLGRFHKFNILGIDNFRPTWHWPAFFLGPFWMFYRKMYLWGLIALLVSLIPYVNFIAWIVTGTVGYYLYYRHVRQKIIELKSASSQGDISTAFSEVGGVHGWLLKVYYGLLLIAFIGIIVSIAIPNFKRYEIKCRQAEAKANLRSLYLSERAYVLAHGCYSVKFDQLNWTPKPSHELNPSGKIFYSYYLSSSEVLPDASNPFPSHIISPALPLTHYEYVAVAVGKIYDRDDEQDIWTISESGGLTHQF